jgi:hypothetical protein
MKLELETNFGSPCNIWAQLTVNQNSSSHTLVVREDDAMTTPADVACGSMLFCRRKRGPSYTAWPVRADLMGTPRGRAADEPSTAAASENDRRVLCACRHRTRRYGLALLLRRGSFLAPTRGERRRRRRPKDVVGRHSQTNGNLSGRDAAASLFTRRRWARSRNANQTTGEHR